MSDSDAPSFSLIDQPWLRVRRTDGTLEELSLLEVLRQAHQLTALAGELPTQVFALTRLLLAVLHQAVSGPRDDEHWEQLWTANTLPADEVSVYLGRYRSRFDLLDPVAPFFQVAGLRTAKGEVSKLTKLIADVPNGNPFFTMRAGRGTASMTFAEAARWVVHAQAFDPSGIKSGAVGDARVQGGRGYPIGVAWDGLLGGVLVEGATLRETLLLNLVARDFPLIAEWAGSDAPVWERPPVGPGEEAAGGRAVLGPVDLYTWQSRRIRLSVTGGTVTGVLISNGERLTPQNKHRVEVHTAWRRSETQEKKHREALVYMPREHTPERSVWRGLQSLLPGTAGRHGSDGQAALAPIVLEWLAHLRLTTILHRDFPMRVRTVGMKYGSNSSVVDEVIDDALSMRAVLLEQDAAHLAQSATHAAEAAEACARALGRLAGTLAEAGGGEFSGPRERAEELAYAELDTPFRTWLASLTEQSQPLEAEQQWHVQADRIIARLARGLVEQASPAAWSGRTVKGNLVTTAHAEMWFRRNLAKAVPMAHPTIPTEQGVSA
jgi:CRISPR system Cascade subunit CasA